MHRTDSSYSQSEAWRSPVVVDEISTMGELLTLEQAQYELGIDPQAALLGTPRQQQEDQAVMDTIAQAREWCENQVGRTFRAAVVRSMSLRSLPDNRLVEFFHPPLISVDDVEYIDDQGAYQTIDPSEYRVVTGTETKGFLEFKSSFDNPQGDTAVDRWVFTYTSGYVNYPPSAIAACKLMLTLMWDHAIESDIGDRYRESAQSLINTLSWGSYE